MTEPEVSKIVLIGAGSATFTHGLLADMIVDGSPWNVHLVDIDPEALEVAGRLSRKMVDAREAPISVEQHRNQARALPGADFVVTTFAVGGRAAWERDVLIPRRYGVYQPVGDTIMPGGISRALRQIPAMVEIARDVAELAPGARLFNYANPMAAICRAVSRATQAEVVGLCHGVKGGERELAGLLGVEPERCRLTAVGMNHLCFFTRMEVDGQDARPLLREKLREKAPEPENYLRRAVFEETGLWSVLNDRHLAEFFPQFHRDGSHAAGRLGVDAFSFEDTIQGGERAYRGMADQAFGRADLDRSVLERKVGEHEQLVSIIRSLTGNSAGRYSVNVPNRGLVPSLPPEAVVECPARISADGIVPEPVGEVPTFLQAVVQKAWMTVELAVEAALERDEDKFLQAVVADGSAASVPDARAMAAELWQANAPYLEGGT